MNSPTAVAPSGGALVASIATDAGAMTVAQLKANRQHMKEVMAELMEVGVHYGKVPGTDKPTLLKPGAELLFVVFRVTGEPIVEDLSDEDCIRYRVKMRAVHTPSGQTVGWGVGECSTDEDKYKWRRAISQDEWEETGEDRRRWNFKSQVNQVRTNPADAANTILKMAEKRAKCDAALSFSACSDVFNQDLDDIAEWLREKETGAAGEETPPAGKSSSRKAPQAKTSSTPQSGAITTGQLQVLNEAIDRSGVGEIEFCKKFEIDKPGDLPFARLNEALTYCKRIQDGGAP